MRITVPEYFLDFKCIADKCRDSCCIGWEIDVDGYARAKYEALNTPLGNEICEKTSHGCFPLEENGRCAFLDGGGLCRIISEMGEGYLCDICREHPRYYGVGRCGIEGGIGLGCEEAARMILSIKELPRLVETDRDTRYCDEDEYADISEYFRDSLYSSIFADGIHELAGKYKAYAQAADEISFDVCGGKTVPMPKLTYTPSGNVELKKLLKDMLALLLECEALTEDFGDNVKKACEVNICAVLAKENELKALIYYFTHRYVREGVADMSLGQRIVFALGSALVTVALGEVADDDEPIVRGAVLYSKNVEYSTDNVDYILENIDIL